MLSRERVGDLPVVVALGSVDPDLVSGVLDGHCRFVAAPGEAELAVAEGAIARADARVDQALLGRAPALRVIARTGVGTDLIDVPAATARGVAVVITPGAGAAAVAEGAIGMALHLVKRFGPLTTLVREGRWAERADVSVGDLDAWIAKLKSEKVTFLEQPYTIGGLRAVIIEGPSKEAIEIVEVKPF